MPLITLTPFTTNINTYYSYAMSLNPLLYWRLGDISFQSIDDSFDGADNSSPNEQLWVTSSSTINIQNNKLNYTDTTSGNVGDYRCLGTKQFDGDFDMQIDFDLPVLLESPTISNHGITFGLSNVYITRGRSTNQGNIYRFDLYDETFSTLIATFNTTTTDTVGKLRLTRVGSTYTAYYWNSSLLRWEWNGDVNGVSGSYAYNFDADVNSSPYIIFQKGDVACDFNFDNFIVSSGANIPRLAIDSTNTHHGTYKNKPFTGNPSLLNTDNDPSVLLNGTNNYINIDYIHNNVSTVSVACLVNFVDNSTKQMFYGELNDLGQIAHSRIRLGINDSVNWFYAIGDGTNAYSNSTIPHNLINGTTYHIVYVINGTSIKIYVDGQLVVTDTSTIPLGTSASDPWTIGRLGSYNGQYLNGAIDEVGLYTKELTALEISELYLLATQ